MKAYIAETSCIIAVVLIICGTTTHLAAETQYSYRISIDATGSITSGSGTGYLGNWYYYPATDQYIMWFDNRPFAANSSITLELGAGISPLSNSVSSYTYHTAYCWTNTKWSNAGDSTPPLPDYVQDESTFNKYIDDSPFFSGTRSSSGGAISYSDQFKKIRNINPAWIGFMVSGSNVTIAHSIILGVTDTSTVPVPSSDPTGACCNPNTGTCTITTLANCPYNWLGEGTTCSSCQTTSALYDYGDAPAPYPVLNSDNGARHYVVNGFYLGSGITADNDGQPSYGASSDQDDGVEFVDDLVINSMAAVRITASTGLGKLSAWIDFNGDGDWADSGEKIFSDQPLTAGTNEYIINIPATAKAGTTYARFRYSTNTGLSYSGTASDGEVEDYLVTIMASGSDHNPSLPYEAHLPNQQYFASSSQPPVISDEDQSLLRGYTNGSLYYNGPIIVDDWTAQGTRPVIGVRWWGLFDNWTDASLPTDFPAGFHISIWSNSTENLPQTLVWEKVINNPAISYAGIAVDPDGIVPNSVCYEFSSLLSQEDWFYPTQANGTYWIGISAMYESNPTYTWGWLTRDTTTGHTAQQIPYNGTTPSWPPAQSSQVKPGSLTESLDMTFEIISSKVGGASDLYDGWLGDLNGDGVADQQDFQDLIRLFVF